MRQHFEGEHNDKIHFLFSLLVARRCLAHLKVQIEIEKITKYLQLIYIYYFNYYGAKFI